MTLLIGLSPGEEVDVLGTPADELAFVDTDNETTLPSSTVTSTSPEPEFFQPTPEDEEGEDGPFWMTAFGLVLPANTWETNSTDASIC